jgi:hypothetical protein
MADEILESSDSNDDPALVEVAERQQQKLLLAMHPLTSAEELALLSRDEDSAIRRAVTMNPNTPLEALLRLVIDFPQEFLANPVLPRLYASQPDFIQSFPDKVWLALARCEALPAYLLQEYERQLKQRGHFFSWNRNGLEENMRLNVAMNGEVQGDWQKQASTIVKAYRRIRRDFNNSQYFYMRKKVDQDLFLLLHLTFPQMLYSAIDARVWKTMMEQILMKYETYEWLISGCSHIPATYLYHLDRTSYVHIRCQIARYAGTPARLLTRLAKHTQPSVRCAVASNPRVPQKLLDQLANDPEGAVRRAVALHPSVDPVVMELFTYDAEPQVRAAIALNRYLSTESFTLLAHDPDPQVRAAVARNINIFDSLLTELARDTDVAVRKAAAGNPCLPLRARWDLIRDESTAVREQIASNPGLSEEMCTALAADRAQSVQRRVAANPCLPADLLAWFVQKGDPIIWAGVARNPRATAEQLTFLARQNDHDVVMAVAAHKHTPVSVLRDLFARQKRTSDISHSLAVNPHTPVDILAQMIAAKDYPLWQKTINHPAVVREKRKVFVEQLVKEIERTGIDQLPEWVKVGFFEYKKKLPDTILEALATSGVWKDRYLVASYRWVSMERLLMLTHDGNCYVRAKARSRLHTRRQKIQIVKK